MSGQAIDFSQYESTAPDTGKQVDFSKYAGPMTSNGIAAPQGTESTMTAGVKGAKDLLTGAAEGAANTVGNAVSGTARLLNKIPGVGEYLAPKQGIEALEAKTKERSTPENTTQAIGRTGEQIGEWLIPSGAEEKVASLLPKMGKAIPIAARIGTSALESGLRNASQGGSFGTGAEAGVGGELLNQGLQKAAPIVAETALGVTGRMRGHGKTIGDAALIVGTTIAVGAPVLGECVGAAFLYYEPSGGWANATQSVELPAPDQRDCGYFGASASVSGGLVAVGANGEGTYYQGAVYIFDGSTEMAELVPSDDQDSEEMGWALATSGNTIAAGAPDATVGSNFAQGKIYVFGR
jgi:hypothetical protein